MGLSKAHSLQKDTFLNYQDYPIFNETIHIIYTKIMVTLKVRWMMDKYMICAYVYQKRWYISDTSLHSMRNFFLIHFCVLVWVWQKTVLEDEILKQIKTFKKSSFMEKCRRNSVAHTFCTVKDTIMKSQSGTRTKHCKQL